MKEYGAVIPVDDLPAASEYDTGKNMLVSDDPPILIAHELRHDYVPDINYDAYEDEGTPVVYQFFIQVVSDLERLDEYGKDGVPIRVVLNHAVNHTGLSDDEAYEILTVFAEPEGPLRIDSSGRVTAE